MATRSLAGLLLLFAGTITVPAFAQSTDTSRGLEATRQSNTNINTMMERDTPDVPYGPGRAFRQSCQPDYIQFCSGGEYPPLPFEAACLRQSWLNLSTPCKQALQQRANANANGGPTDTQAPGP